MVTEVVAILDRLIALLERRERNRRQFFEEHINPTFQDLTTIHEDYLAAFKDVESALNNYKLSSRELYAHIEKRRQEMEHLREKLFALQLSLEQYLTSNPKNYPEQALAFVRSVIDYFHLGAGEGTKFPIPEGGTYFTTLLDMIFNLEIGHMHRGECMKIAEVFQDDVRRKWSEITVTYAKVKITCLAPV